VEVVAAAAKVVAGDVDATGLGAGGVVVGGTVVVTTVVDVEGIAAAARLNGPVIS